VIRNWTVANFKSIGREELELAPLTLFAGANSSGKSTLLQSILLITQTLSARANNQTLLLNGHLTKQGELDDIRNSVTKQRVISIGWNITPVAIEENAPINFINRIQAQIESLRCEVEFGVSEAAQPSEQLDPVLFNMKFSSHFRESAGAARRESYFRLKRKHSPKEESSSPTERARTRIVTDFEINMDNDSLEELRDSYANAKPVALSLQAFLPASLVLVFDQKAEMIRALHAVLTGAPRRPSRAHTMTLNLPRSFVTRLLDYLPQLEDDLTAQLMEYDPDDIPGQDLLEVIRRANIRSEMTPDLISTIEAMATNELPQEEEPTWAPLPTRPLDAPIDYMRDIFTRQVKYLGPLREEPRSVYPLQNTADPQDVGLQGEHTAAVFHRNRFTEVEWVPSSTFEDGESDSYQIKTVPLEEAVFDWITYLDVAEKVSTSDEGKYGYSLKVTMEHDSVSHDLTHVGVGVSQVLPIVVMCLLAGRDTTLILEQPELHLNPKVQTRLADFFLSMAMLQKQCLIETHSEYLVNRLRLRAVRAEGTSVSDLIKLYFVEKTDGLTRYRDVRLNEFGTLLDWPKGFFDQSQQEVEEILLAASRKGH
jgi:predicted ATPase